MAIRRIPPLTASGQAREIDAELGRTIARTLHLLSQAAMVGVCRGRMRNLVRHLAQLAEHPAAGSEVRGGAETLLRAWREAQQEHFGPDENTPRH
ncbi:hypothetical protein [Pseudothauera rhizosphaerae]|uniref:Uncharacterized protein n=1 Tax=Pseudothauera rhizosphaerae TaxID=2565932 RepID=A0A4S4AIF1_9RHOO|nr:hypothetical protein [Pseudothauera rhizosphaerae]THF58616.1 hypothetical protein E6O51_16625 [Pseudothauera rhizosphaerae]